MRNERIHGFGRLLLFSLPFVLGSCETMMSTIRSGPVAGSARGAIDNVLVSDRIDVGMSESDLRKALTRSQKIIYGSNYYDFYATLQTRALLHFEGKAVNPPNQSCFEIRVETDDRRYLDGLSWDAYLRRMGTNFENVSFVSFVRSPVQQYPLIYTGTACANYTIDPPEEVYLFVKARFTRGSDPVRLEWTFTA